MVDENGVIVVGHTRYKGRPRAGPRNGPRACGHGPDARAGEGVPPGRQSDRHAIAVGQRAPAPGAGRVAEDGLRPGPDRLHAGAVAGPAPASPHRAPDGPRRHPRPAPPDKATTQPGDVWLLGQHRLLCGDSSLPAHVDLLLAGTDIHLVNTDPPYNVKVEPRSNNAIAAGLSSFQGNTHHQSGDLHCHPEKAKPTGKKLRAKDRPLANDFVSDQEFDRLLAAWFGNVARMLQPGRAFYIWGGYSNVGNYPPVLKANGLYFSQAIIWVKEHPVLTRKDFMGNHEWAFYGWREGAAHKYFGPKNATDVWPVKKLNHTQMVHLTEKPVELATRALEYSSKPGERVLDLFGGSGSTLIAAEQTGRRAYLMELDPLYCDVIVARYEKFTGKQAQRATSAAISA